MTTFLLIRHGNTTVRNRIAGREPGVLLSGSGIDQVTELATRLAALPITHIVSSPLDRTRETAEAIAKMTGKTVEYSDALTEVDFGEWTGKTLEELEGLEQWQLRRRFRTGLRIPGGELIVEVQSRIASELARLCQRFPDEVVVVVSHGDPIRAAIAYYIGLPLDHMQRLKIDTASVSVLAVNTWGAELIRLNNVYEIPQVNCGT
jgi:broad specificity phosphatase PhoE